MWKYFYYIKRKNPIKLLTLGDLKFKRNNQEKRKERQRNMLMLFSSLHSSASFPFPRASTGKIKISIIWKIWESNRCSVRPRRASFQITPTSYTVLRNERVYLERDWQRNPGTSGSDPAGPWRAGKESSGNHLRHGRSTVTKHGRARDRRVPRRTLKQGRRALMELRGQKAAIPRIKSHVVQRGRGDWKSQDKQRAVQKGHVINIHGSDVEGRPFRGIIFQTLFTNISTFRINPEDKAQKSSLWMWKRVWMLHALPTWKYRCQNKGGKRGKGRHTDISAQQRRVKRYQGSLGKEVWGEGSGDRQLSLLFRDTDPTPTPVHLRTGLRAGKRGQRILALFHISLIHLNLNLGMCYFN